MRVFLYTKPGCSPCEHAKKSLQGLAQEYPHRLVEVDITTEASLQKQYGEEVPVIQVGPYTLKAPFDERDLRVTLGAARDSQNDLPDKKRKLKGDQALWLNRAVLFFARHWLVVFNLLVFTYASLPFAAPVLMKNGVQGPARAIYTAYSPLCHQLAFRSWFLFGDQSAYPRELAGTNYTSFGEATGIDEGDLYAARDFIGNEQIGYKVALCERDVAIYGSILLAGLIFGIFRKKLKPLPIALWVLFGIVPMAVDGGSQLIAGIPLPGFDLIPARESTPFLRTLTGGLFGVMNVWMAYPYVEETMSETRALVSAKIKAATEAEPTT
ncbi:MAG: DUF2085 domain-containing protein [Anaerolineales bacterium]